MLLIKTVQGSLGDEDGKSVLIVIVYEVWLSWRKEMPRFLGEHSKLQEGWVGKSTQFPE